MSPGLPAAGVIYLRKWSKWMFNNSTKVCDQPVVLLMPRHKLLLTANTFLDSVVAKVGVFT